ncbi:glucose receptor git3 protein [Diplodia corticola]|uniref:Glucose receptor git3 protein n=1 Tax=Diplodia corticola TaxID=236234 RepID=A0A1J9RWL8_9PEZI|nr:glucose receptor git3 protein [Diplodia corticola]OJD31877.1 glucose receptor git3 protein [Diplodia corticola]
MNYDPAISVPTLVGSLLSCLASACVLLSYVLLAPQQPSFRHALVFNLALTEFINSLNNSVSGVYVVERRNGLIRGTACQLNGFVNQLSVQAADFAILAITLLTFLTVIKKTYIPSESWSRTLAICASVWCVPMTTSSIAAGLSALQPFGGNWCWISVHRTDLRYALGHGWRFCIIVATICMYIYMYTYIQRHFSSSKAAFGAHTPTLPAGRGPAKMSIDLLKPRSAVSQVATDTKLPQVTVALDRGVSRRPSERVETARQSFISTTTNQQPESLRAMLPESIATTPTSTTTNVKVDAEASVCRNSEFTLNIPSQGLEMYLPDYSRPPSYTIMSRRLREKPSQTLTIDTTIAPASPPPRELFDSPTSIRTHLQQQAFHRHAQVEREVRRTLLLNAYPIAYVILWLPGIANRLVEAVSGTSPRWLLILQSTTQYVGLANALTYGFNEHMRSMLGRDGNEGYGWSWRRGLV